MIYHALDRANFRLRLFPEGRYKPLVALLCGRSPLPCGFMRGALVMMGTSVWRTADER